MRLVQKNALVTHIGTLLNQLSLTHGKSPLIADQQLRVLSTATSEQFFLIIIRSKSPPPLKVVGFFSELKSPERNLGHW